MFLWQYRQFDAAKEKGIQRIGQSTDAYLRVEPDPEAASEARINYANAVDEIQRRAKGTRSVFLAVTLIHVFGLASLIVASEYLSVMQGFAIALVVALLMLVGVAFVLGQISVVDSVGR